MGACRKENELCRLKVTGSYPYLHNAYVTPLLSRVKVASAVRAAEPASEIKTFRLKTGLNAFRREFWRTLRETSPARRRCGTAFAAGEARRSWGREHPPDRRS